MTERAQLASQVPDSEKERLFNEVKADLRFGDYLYGCYECGICVAVCPSARFYDFSPRRIAQAVAREDVELVWEQMNGEVWECSQCFSCLLCPRGNNPGGIITIMREVAVKNGLHSAQQALEGYTRIIYKIMSTGTQVSPDMIRPEAFPDWGPTAKETADNLEVWRRAMPPDTMHTTSASWEVDDKTLTELYLIWHLSGVLDMIKALDESLHMILVDVMEEKLEEAGYPLS
ncbi:MAG: heterodisulfide reductase subunit C [Candidatus Rokubacteria bacterium GWF2_70_14]|nr:MAG: heterodisulfide reductase subunit C [Candidatus Rokubacteria bacterium GWA2_70_23]OGK90592.1 MAG: heterodisulfide reductase subunit C [Candidatus Rokubacteria bacterium GWF2_70_14]